MFFRFAGRRTLAQLTTFDFVLLLIIGEAIQNGLLGSDFSLTNAFLTIATLLLIDVVLSYLKQYLPLLEKATDGVPILIVEHGRLIERHMDINRVDAEDVLEAARDKMGLERLEQIKYAVLEKTGEISIIPNEPAPARARHP